MPVVDISGALRANQWLLAATNEALDEAADEAGRQGVEHVYQSPGFKPKTGNLQRATSYRVLKLGGRVLRLQNTKPYAPAIDTGARPHVILPRNGTFLRFWSHGALVFARKVNHPGNRPYKFLWSATYAAGRVLEQGIAYRMSSIASRFSKR